MADGGGLDLRFIPSPPPPSASTRRGRPRDCLREEPLEETRVLLDIFPPISVPDSQSQFRSLRRNGNGTDYG